MDTEQIIDKIVEEHETRDNGTDKDLRKAILLTKQTAIQIIEETTFGHDHVKMKYALIDRIRNQI